MKKGQILEGYIERVDFPNKGFAVVEDEEKKVIVKNTVPEQKVRFAVNKIRKGQAEGRLLEILEHSPEECQPACPHFGVCGGCTYQNLPYEKQVEMKEAQIHAMMDAAVDGDYIWEGVKESPVREAYRNKMEFSFGDEYKDGPLALGMHKRGSFHDIVNVTECKIVDEDFRRIIKAVLEFATDTGLPYYHRMRHTGFFRHLLVRKAVRTGEILIDLVTTSEAQLDEARLVEKLTGLSYDGKLAGILHTTNNSLADVVKDEGTKILYGQDYFYEELLGLKFKITPFSFFQTNSLGAEVLYEAARSYIGETKDKVIFDLYSGTGTIAQILAPVAKKVVGVEIVEEAVEAAKENAEKTATASAQAAGQALKDLAAAEERAESSSQLAAEKEKTISTLAEKLSSAEEKGKKYDGLYESKKTAQEQIHALERTIKELEKDHATEKRELQSEAEQKLSAAQKDAALETLNAVAAKEREMNGQLLQLERENAKLQAKIELLEARLQQQP